MSGFNIFQQECIVQFEEDRVHNPHPTEEEEGIISHPFPFAYDDVLTNISNSEDEGQDDHDIDIENEPHKDPDPTPYLNQRPKWAQNLIESARNKVRDPEDRIITRSQYQDENLALFHRDPLLLERCFMMMGSDP